VRLKTHTTDSVPYLLVDSAVDGPGGVYSEPATAAAIPIPGFALMGKLVLPTP
jgi:2,3-bisphosphoglycerate-independent phosphoglycerate mutase